MTLSPVSSRTIDILKYQISQGGYVGEMARAILFKYSEDEARGEHGRWVSGGASGPSPARQAAQELVDAHPESSAAKAAAGAALGGDLYQRDRDAQAAGQYSQAASSIRSQAAQETGSGPFTKAYTALMGAASHYTGGRQSGGSSRGRSFISNQGARELISSMNSAGVRMSDIRSR